MSSAGPAGSALAPAESPSIRKLHDAREKIVQQLSKVIVGQHHVIEELLISLFSRGHCLLEGVPGLAKTLLISTLARSLDLTFSRIQFTPDLMPAGIIERNSLQPVIDGAAAMMFFLVPDVGQNPGEVFGSKADDAVSGLPLQYFVAAPSCLARLLV